MMHPLKTQAMTEVRLALEQEDKILPYRRLVSIFWGVILAKCFLAEWAIQGYIR